MRTDTTTDEVAELLEELHPDRVFVVEDGRVWVSGMNARCKSVAEDMAKTIRMHLDAPTSLIHSDGVHAINNGGVEFRFGEKA